QVPAGEERLVAVDRVEQQDHDDRDRADAVERGLVAEHGRSRVRAGGAVFVDGGRGGHRGSDAPPPAPPPAARDGSPYSAGNQLPCRPAGTRAGRCTTATGDDATRAASRITRSLRSRARSYANTSSQPSSSSQPPGRGAKTGLPTTTPGGNRCSDDVPLSTS